jgi:hypothetical protein
MTFIKPNRTRALNMFRVLFVGMIGLILAGVVAMVVLYNQAVTAHHASNALHDKIVEVEAANAEGQQQLMASLDSSSLASFAASRGLVEDRAPEYLSADPQTWVFASRF